MSRLRTLAWLGLLSVAFAAILSAAAAYSISFPMGPYVTNVTPTSATVLWITNESSPHYGADPDEPGSNVAPFRVNRMMLTGLKPATAYSYDVPGAQGVSFTTPPNGHGGFTFAVYGDVRTRHDVHRRVVEQIAAAQPTFLVNTGDLVANGLSPSEWPVFFAVSRDLFRAAPFFPAIGNHDRNSPYWHQFFDRTSNYYSFDWGNVHFAVLDSDGAEDAPNGDGEAYWREQLAWLEKDLENSRNAGFRFLVLHHPPYTAMASRKRGAEEIARRVVPLLRQRGVQAVFSGHDHNYQRHLDGGIQYVVTGGGGAPLYDVGAPIRGITQKAYSVENYLFAQVDDERVRFEARALDGRVLDRFEIASSQGK